MFRIALRWAGIALGGAMLVALALLLKPVPIEVPAIEPRATTRYWTMPGGYRIAYSRISGLPGVPQKPPVIFLHGGPGGYVHSSVIALLGRIAADGRDVYFYDQSGTGLSDRRARPKDTSIAGHLRDLETIRRMIGAPRVALIGQSFGGMLAALYAADHPERIERIVLTSPGTLRPEAFDAQGRATIERRYPIPADFGFTPPAGYAEATGAGAMPVRALAAFTLAQIANVKWASDREMDAAINSMARRFTRTMVCDPAHVLPEEGGAGGYSRVGSNFFPDGFVDRRPAMRRMRAPVLVLQGQCDFIPYAEAYEYAALFPRGSYRFVPGAGHILWWDRPEAVLAIIRGFLAGP